MALEEHKEKSIHAKLDEAIASLAAQVGIKPDEAEEAVFNYLEGFQRRIKERASKHKKAHDQ
jgi:hypothetical protein